MNVESKPRVNLTRAQVITGSVSLVMLVFIGFLLVESFSLLATGGHFVFGEFLPLMPESVAGGVASLILSVAAYFLWLEFGFSLVSKVCNKVTWLRKPVM